MAKEILVLKLHCLCPERWARRPCGRSALAERKRRSHRKRFAGFYTRHHHFQCPHHLFDVTERPPVGAAAARILFSKESAAFPLLLDLVNLAPVETPNLVRNPSFEQGLSEWSSSGFAVSEGAWEGGAAVKADEQCFGNAHPRDTTESHPARSRLSIEFYRLISAAGIAHSTADLAECAGQSHRCAGNRRHHLPQYAGGSGQILELFAGERPSPIGAVRARLIYTALGEADSELDLDQVILVRISSPNLLQNPGFANGLIGLINENVTHQNTGGYVGQKFAELASCVALINQTVALPFGSACHSFLLNFALRYRNAPIIGNVLAQVRWLDARGAEIGLGLALVISQASQTAEQWQVYTGFTERARPGATSPSFNSQNPREAATVK